MDTGSDSAIETGQAIKPAKRVVWSNPELTRLGIHHESHPALMELEQKDRILVLDAFQRAIPGDRIKISLPRSRGRCEVIFITVAEHSDKTGRTVSISRPS